MKFQGATGPSGSARFDSGSAGDAGFVKFEGEFVEFVTGQTSAHVTKHWLAQHPISGFSEEQIKHLISAVVSQVGLENAKAVVEGFSEDEKALCVRRLKVESFKRDLQKDAEVALDKILKESLENETDRIELAMIAAEQEEGVISRYIHKFNISDQDALIKIARKAAAQNGRALSFNIGKYGIIDPKERASIAKIAAAQDGLHTSQFITKYNITDQTDLIEIAKIAVNQNAQEVLLYIYHYELKSLEALREVILSLDTSDPAVLPYRSLLDEVKEVSPSENMLIGLAKINAARDGASTSLNIDMYGITDQTALIEIAKIAAAQSGWGVSAHIGTYEIKDQAALVEIAKIAAAQDGCGTSQLIKYYGIEDPRALNEIFLCALASDINSVVHVNNFFPEVNKSNYIPLNTLEKLREDSFSVRFVLDHLLGFGEDKPLTRSLLDLRNPTAKKRALQLIGKYSRELKETTLNEPLDIVRSLMNKLKGVEIKIKSGSGKDKFTPRELRNAILEQQLIITSYDLLLENDLNKNDVEKLLNLVTGSSSKIRALQKISAIIALGRVDLLKECGELDEALETAFKDAVGVQGIENFSQKFCETFGEFRDPQALFIYAGQLKKLPEPDRSLVLQDLRSYIQDVITDKFHENRSKDLDPRWVEGSRIKISITSSGTAFNFVELLRTSFGDQHISQEVIRNVTPYLDDPNKELKDELNSYEKKLILLAREGAKHLDSLQEALKDYEGKEQEIKKDVEGWISATKASKCGLREYTLLDGDDPSDFLLMGTEVLGSCQRVNGDPNLNKGLAGTMLDGHNRLLLLKDTSEKIVGRALLRLVKEGDKPALLLERIYPQTLGHAEKEQLMNFAKKRSEVFGWQLYGVAFEGAETAAILTSVGGIGAYQYIDSVNENMPSGTFTVHNPKRLA